MTGRRVIAIERDEKFIPLIWQRIDRQLNPMRAARVMDSPDALDLFGEPA